MVVQAQRKLVLDNGILHAMILILEHESLTTQQLMAISVKT